MRKRVSLVLSTLLILILAVPFAAAENPKAGAPGDLLIVSGTISDAQKKPLKDAELSFYIGGKKIELGDEVATGKNGAYKVEISLPAGSLSGAVVEVEAERHPSETPDVSPWAAS